MDLTDACRSCMKKIKYSEKRDNLKTLELFCFCLNMKISGEDNLPKQFCKMCIDKIEAAHTFITTAQKVDLTLRKLLSLAETNVVVEPKVPKNEINKEIKLEPVNKESLSEKIVKTEMKREDVTTDTVTIKRVRQTLNDCSGKGLRSVKVEDNSDIYEDNIVSSESNDGINEPVNTPTTAPKKVLKDHKIIKKGKTKNECLICSKKFETKLLFYEHMKKEHGKKAYSLSCDECGKCYKTEGQLIKHKKVHAVCKSFVCNICSKSFKNQSYLSYHIGLHQKRKFLCCVCGKDFAIKSSLTTHMRVHTGEKPYKCTECPKAFKTSTSCRQHERVIHRGEHAYVCETCSQRFTSAGSLIRHRRKHTGELPYKCPWCSNAFIDNWKRKAHMVREHNISMTDIPHLAGGPPRVTEVLTTADASAT